MRIGIDGGCLSNRRGFGRFSRQLINALAAANSQHQFVAIVDRPSLDQLRIPSGFEIRVAEVEEAPSRAASSDGRRRVADLLRMGQTAAGADLDLLYFPASYSFFPVWNVPRVVVTIHDALPLIHPELVFPNWRGRWTWTLKEHMAVHWADRIVTVSQASRRDLIRLFALDPGRVHVIPEGPDPCFVPRSHGPDSDAVLRRWGLEPGIPYLLYVGGLSPHKNLPRLIRAYARAVPREIPLALVGDLADVFHTHVPELRRIIQDLNLEDRVRFTGFVPDPDLAHLYGRAMALVQPSLLEGFGLPAIEAMACGTPVLFSRTGSLPEVIGDAGLGFDPTDIPGMAAAIQSIVSDAKLRDRLARKALERAKRFTWSAAACSLLEVFESIKHPLDSPRRRSA